MARRKKTNRKEHHVVPNKKGGWDVKINDAGHRTYHTRKKSTAIKKARAISRKHKTELVIHNSKGRIEVKNSHKIVRRGKPGPKKHKKAKRRVKKTVRRIKRKVRKAKAKRRTRKAVRKTKRKVRRTNRKTKRRTRKTVRRVKRKVRRTKRKVRRVVKKAKRRARRRR